jgi:hypothetical protein
LRVSNVWSTCVPLYGEANMQARVSAAQSNGLIIRVREVQNDAAVRLSI